MRDMRSSDPDNTGSNKAAANAQRLLWTIVACAWLIALIAVFLPRPKTPSPDRAEPPNATSGNSSSERIAETSPAHRRIRSTTKRQTAKSAEEIIAEKVKQFGKSRRAIAERIAARLNQEMPLEIRAFFDAIEDGNWPEIERRWKELATHTHQYDHSRDDRPDLEPYWAAVLDAYGVAEQAHLWPAQKLLDYGNAILESLRPGMVYVGGTDNGRWVPTLLNETGSNPHIIVTQNALADGTYLDFLRELYSDSFNTLTQEDSQRAFQEYTADAQKRLQHDLDFPDEPKQIRSGESVTMKDGKVQVSGVTAVMGINEKLLQMLMEKNPDLSFAMQESFPMRGTYADAVPLGPLMELGVNDAQTTFTSGRAAQSVNYWQSVAQATLNDPEALGSETTLRSYSHDVNSTANLLAAHNFTTEAEQAYRIATQLWPANADAAGGLANLLAQTGRTSEARQLLDNFARDHPDQRSALEKMSITFLWTAPATKPTP